MLVAEHSGWPMVGRPQDLDTSSSRSCSETACPSEQIDCCCHRDSQPCRFRSINDSPTRAGLLGGGKRLNRPGAAQNATRPTSASLYPARRSCSRACARPRRFRARGVAMTTPLVSSGRSRKTVVMAILTGTPQKPRPCGTRLGSILGLVFKSTRSPRGPISRLCSSASGTPRRAPMRAR